MFCGLSSIGLIYLGLAFSAVRIIPGTRSIYEFRAKSWTGWLLDQSATRRRLKQSNLRILTSIARRLIPSMSRIKNEFRILTEVLTA